jgi:nonsense-mediated mRNA decay protein 3
MSFKKFCPRCGKEKDFLVGKICVDCFMEGKEFFSMDKINMTVCKHCSKLKVRGKWIEFSDSLIAEEVASKVNVIDELKDSKVFVEIEKYSEIDYEAKVKVTGILSNQLVEKESFVKFQLKDVTCDACMKLNADYREAIIQLRSSSKDTAKEMYAIAIDLLSREKSKNTLADTSKVIEIKNGYDLWVGSKNAAAKVARRVAQLFDVQIKNSRKLTGRENGKDKYRNTYCIKK